MRRVTNAIRQSLYTLGLLGFVKRHYYVWCDRFRLPQSERMLQGIICPLDLVFDIGAFVGSRTFVFTSMGARVVAVEPQPACVEILKRRFAKAPSVVIVAGVVSAESGEADLWIDDQMPEIASVRHEWVMDGPTKAKGSRVRSLRVEKRTIDALIVEFGQPKYIKIDAEGHEREILQGLSSPCEYISFEIHRNDPQKLKECLQEMRRLGEYHLNLTLGDGETFLFPEWRTIDEFLAWTWPADSDEFADLFLRRGLSASP